MLFFTRPLLGGATNSKVYAFPDNPQIVSPHSASHVYSNSSCAQTSPAPSLVGQALDHSFSEKSIAKEERITRRKKSEEREDRTTSDDRITQCMQKVFEAAEIKKKEEREKRKQEEEKQAARDTMMRQQWEQELREREMQNQRERQIVEYHGCSHQQNFRSRDDLLDEADTQPPESRMVVWQPRPSYQGSCVGTYGPRNSIQVVGSTNRNLGWRNTSRICPSPSYRSYTEHDHR